MGLSNVNFVVGKTGKTGLDRVKQQNYNNQRNPLFESVSKRSVSNGGQLAGISWTHTGQPTLALPKTDSPLVSRSLLTRIFLSWAGEDGSPCSQVVCVSNAFWRPFSLIPELFTVGQCFHPSAWCHQGQSETAGLWVTCRWPGTANSTGLRLSV